MLVSTEKESLLSLLSGIKFELLLTKHIIWMLILDCWELFDLHFPVIIFLVFKVWEEIN